MATTKETQPTKLTAAQLKKKVETQQEKIKSLKEGAWCYMCDTHKSKDKFYKSTNPMIKSGLTPICKDCARKIALKIGSDKIEHNSDKESAIMALRYLDKPFLDDLWDASISESEDLTSGKIKTNCWNAYIKNVSMPQYNCMTFLDGDNFGKINTNEKDDICSNIQDKSTVNDDTLESFVQNKKDTIRLLGYDPFAKELISDQPYLYASLIGYLDSSEDANEDRLKTSSSIEIVKSFSHIEKINDVITTLMSDIQNMEKNISTIKNLEDTKNKITNSVLNLAKDNGISLKHSVNSSKGENTWTGKVRKMKEMKLTEAETNLYDIEYSNGLQQVAEISDAAIIKQIRLDENDYNDMIIQQRELINKYKKKAEDNEEKARILLKENYDLKSLLKDNEIDLESSDDA